MRSILTKKDTQSRLLPNACTHVDMHTHAHTYKHVYIQLHNKKEWEKPT